METKYVLLIFGTIILLGFIIGLTVNIGLGAGIAQVGAFFGVIFYFYNSRKEKQKTII